MMFIDNKWLRIPDIDCCVRCRLIELNLPFDDQFRRFEIVHQRVCNFGTKSAVRNSGLSRKTNTALLKPLARGDILYNFCVFIRGLKLIL